MAPTLCTHCHTLHDKPFLPGRFIGENTRLIYDLLHFTEKENVPGLLVFIDFQKAVDSV